MENLHCHEFVAGQAAPGVCRAADASSERASAVPQKKLAHAACAGAGESDVAGSSTCRCALAYRILSAPETRGAALNVLRVGWFHLPGRAGGGSMLARSGAGGRHTFSWVGPSTHTTHLANEIFPPWTVPTVAPTHPHEAAAPPFHSNRPNHSIPAYISVDQPTPGPPSLPMY